MGLFGIKPLTLADAPLSNLEWVWFGIALCAATHLLLRNLLNGRFGRAFLSIQADEIASASVGVRVYHYKVLAFVVAAVTCGVAGALVAQQNQYINSDFINFHLSIFILLLVLFGGSGSLYGPLLGAVLLTLIDALLAQWPAVQHFAYGGLLLFALRCPVPSKGACRRGQWGGAARGQRGLEVVWRGTSRAGRVLPAGPRAHPCIDRPQRCRQEHDDQHDHRRDKSGRGKYPIPRKRNQGGEDPCNRPSGRGTDLPESSPLLGPVSS